MTTKTIRIVSIALLGLSLALWASIIIPSINIKKPSVTTNQPTWQETSQPLTEIETATMGADFVKDFEKNLETINAPPTPTSFLISDIPASMAGDLMAPTVTIQGGPMEGTTVAPNVCFSLWVSDNMTPWNQLATRGKIDTIQWSTWYPMTSYCYQNLNDGTHTFTVQIRDLAGNVSSEIKRTFIVKR